jgi:hypothetical protein
MRAYRIDVVGVEGREVKWDGVYFPHPNPEYADLMIDGLQLLQQVKEPGLKVDFASTHTWSGYWDVSMLKLDGDEK